jgi:hypothetical protein
MTSQIALKAILIMRSGLLSAWAAIAPLSMVGRSQGRPRRLRRDRPGNPETPDGIISSSDTVKQRAPLPQQEAGPWLSPIIPRG